MRKATLGDSDCAIAQALGVVGDFWSLLVVRDVAGGAHRFEELQAELGGSRKILAQRLRDLVADGVLTRTPYQSHPPRYEYRLAPAGEGLLPVLVALQTWGAQHVAGDGSVTGSGTETEVRRVRALVGSTLPALKLRSSTSRWRDPVGRARWTVLYGYPGAYAPGDPGHPPGWGRIPGAPGCTLESTTFRDRAAEFADRGTAVLGVSTQRHDRLASFAAHAELPFALLSDADLQLAAALRLPTFRVGGEERIKRITLLVDRRRVVRDVLYPVDDPAGAVQDALESIDAIDSRRGEVRRDR